MRSSNFKLTLLASLLLFFYSLTGFGLDTVEKTVVSKWILQIHFDEETEPDAQEYFAYHRRVSVTTTGEDEQTENNQIPMVPLIPASALDEARTSGRFGDWERGGLAGSYRFFPENNLPPEVASILDETLSYAHAAARFLAQMNAIQRQVAPHRTNMPQAHTMNPLRIRAGRDWGQLLQPGTLLMIGVGAAVGFGIYSAAAIPSGHRDVMLGSPVLPIFWGLAVTSWRTALYRNLWQIRLNLYRDREDPGVMTAESAELYARVIPRLDEETYLSERRHMSHVQQIIYLRYFPDTITTSEEALSFLSIVPEEQDGDSIEVSRVTELPVRFPDAFPPDPSIAAGETSPDEAVTGDAPITINEKDGDEEDDDGSTPLLPNQEPNSVVVEIERGNRDYSENNDDYSEAPAVVDTRTTIANENATTSAEQEPDLRNAVIDMSAVPGVMFQEFSK